jgi:intein/homing endonuclease
MKGSVERQGKNQPIQGCVGANTVVKGVGKIKQLVGKSIGSFQTGMGITDAVGAYSGKKILHKLKLSNGVSLDITLDHSIPVVTQEGILKDKCVKDINIGRDLLLIPLDVIAGTASDISGYKYEKGHWRSTHIDYNYPEVMDRKLSFVIGCLLGDGNYSRHDYFRFVCNKSEKELFDKYNKYVKDLFGYDPVTDEVKKKNSILLTAQVSSVVLRGFLKYVGLDYVINRAKSIPDIFFTETIENKGALLDGLFSTDGGVTKQSGPNFTTTSEQLANGVHQLLFSIGINSNLKTYYNEYGAVYRIQIPKRFINKFMKYVDASINRKRGLILDEGNKFNGKDSSSVPTVIPKFIFKKIRNSSVFNTLTKNQKAHLFRFKKVVALLLVGVNFMN